MRFKVVIGWQMSREFVERPDRLQRCQIVADRLLTSIMNGNQATLPARCRTLSCSTPRP